MSKKIYVWIINPEFTRWEEYMDEDSLIEEKIAIYGNSDFTEFNNYYKKYEDKVYDCLSDLELPDRSLELGEISESEYFDDIENTYNYYFTLDAKTKLTSKQLQKISKLVDEVDKTDFDEDKCCKILEVVYGEPFVTGTIRGNSQGDWEDYICPKSLYDNGRMNYYESVFFGLGVEVEYTDLVDEVDINDEDALVDFRMNNTVLDYLEDAPYSEEKLKDILSKRVNCNKEDIVVVNGNEYF